MLYQDIPFFALNHLLRAIVIFLLDVSLVLGVSEYRFGGEQGNPWQVAIARVMAGTYVVLDDNSAPLRWVPVETTPYGQGGEISMDFSTGSLQPRYVDPQMNIVLVSEEDVSNSILPLSYLGGKVYWCLSNWGIASTDAIRKIFDGNVITALYRPRTGSFPPLVVDLNNEVPVNRIRFYPRLGKREDAHYIEQLKEPKFPIDAFGEYSFSENFVSQYEIFVADKTLTLQPCELSVMMSTWFQEVSPFLKPLKIAPENLDVIVDLRFQTRSVRWLVMKVIPKQDWEIAELEVYGKGFIKETEFVTEILDFGKPVVWGKIGWRGEQPSGTKIEIRTRTGNTANPQRYFERDTNGSLREITVEEYTGLDLSTLRMDSVYDVENWSFWSPPYDFDAGLCDTVCPSGYNRNGAYLLSRNPSRYLQVAIRFAATFETAPRLDELVLQFNEELLAHEVVGEIWPIDVASFQRERFYYVVRPVFQEDDTGFDRLEIFTYTRVDTIHSIKLDGIEVDRSQFPAELRDDRIVVSFPRLVGRKDNTKRLEVVFDVEVLRFGAEFKGWVYDNTDPFPIKQPVSPGNATYRFSGDVLAVKTPLGRSALIDVEAVPNPFTPNGDGINDIVQISYKIHDLTQERPVVLTIYDLAGRSVRMFPVTKAMMGEFSNEWDGCDDTGRLVPPGLYVCQVSVEADANEATCTTATQVIAVAY